MDLKFGVFINYITVSAARLIGFMCADHNKRILVLRGFAVHEPLGVMRILAAQQAYGAEFGNLIGDSKQDRHRIEWLAAEIKIKASNDYTFAIINQFAERCDDGARKEMNFIDANYFNVFLVCQREEQLGIINGVGINLAAVMGVNVFDGRAAIDWVFEGDHLFAGNFCPAQSADKLLRFARKHGTTNNL
jgi:hypothetical protein